MEPLPGSLCASNGRWSSTAQVTATPPWLCLATPSTGVGVDEPGHGGRESKGQGSGSGAEVASLCPSFPGWLQSPPPQNTLSPNTLPKPASTSTMTPTPPRARDASLSFLCSSTSTVRACPHARSVAASGGDEGWEAEPPTAPPPHPRSHQRAFATRHLGPAGAAPGDGAERNVCVGGVG